jgi:hypothetical protein
MLPLSSGSKSKRSKEQAAVAADGGYLIPIGDIISTRLHGVIAQDPTLDIPPRYIMKC